MGKHRHDDAEDNPLGNRVGNKDPERRGLDKTIEQQKQEREADRKSGESK